VTKIFITVNKIYSGAMWFGGSHHGAIKMNRGRVLLSGNAEECRKFKRDTYLWTGWILIFIILFGNFNPDVPPIVMAEDIRVVLLYIFSVGVLLYIIIGIGARINLFAIYERGISPPAKPWSRVFAREYFIPYREIKEVNLENAPVYYELILKDGRRVPMKAWWLYRFFTAGNYKKVERFMKIVADFIEDQNGRERRGEKAEWALRAEDLQG